MRSTRLQLLLILSLFLTIFSISSTARADDNDESDDYDVDARVVRISLISGEVTLKRHDAEDWDAAKLNTPLVEGDTLATGRDARAEIQIDARNFVRIAPDSVLKIVSLRNEGIALSLATGTATLRLARFDKDHEYFEIDAPKTTIAAESKGLYRLEADREGAIKLTVRDGGRARVYSDSAGFTVRDGHTAVLTYEGDQPGDWQTTVAEASDKWDSWVTDREKYLASRLKYDESMRYYEPDIWGAEDLDSYGTWAYANDYGWIWQPNITIINNYNDWAPYRYGQWVWCSPYGWTWVGEEPWGWAPYHYGRWVYYNNYWAWCPHSYYRPRHNWWRPALVAFASIDFNFGSNYCWYPLSYRQHDPLSLYYQRHRDRLTPLGSNELANLRRTNPAYFRAVTAVPARDFGNRSGRGQPASADLAGRVIGAQPLRGNLPARPAVVSGNNAGTNRVARPAVPATGVASRPTGAAIRTPGVPLDNELRRTRIFNGREPLPKPPNANDGRRTDAGVIEPRPTGAVTRPTRPLDAPATRDRTLEIKRDPTDSGTPDNNPVDRSARPVRPRDDRPASPPASGRKAERPAGPTTDMPAPPARPREERPVTPPDAGRKAERPAGPTTDMPAPSSRPREERPSSPQNERPVKPNPSPPTRSEAPRSEAPRPSPPPQRSEPPPQRSEPPAQRSEPPPQRSEPPPQRSEPPPQRSEPPAQRSEPPPQRSEPPPQRSEPPAQRSDPPARSETPAAPRKPKDNLE
jgi:FecR protein